MDQVDTLYMLPHQDMIMRHASIPLLVVRDSAFFRIPRVDAAVRSKDYFTTLATTIETIRMDIEDDNPAIAQALDNLVYDLEYLQRHYAIVSKETLDRDQDL